MNKKQSQKFIDNLDLQQAEAEFEQMKREMEEDKKKHDFSIPKEWDDDFRAVMDDAFKKKKIKKGINVRSKLAMAAGVALAVFVGSTLSTETVHGNKLLDIFGKTSGTEDERFEMYGTEQDFDSAVGMDEVITFEGETLSELYANIRSEMKRPMFQIDDIPVEYEIELVEYDSNFRTLNIQLLTQDGWIYITQEEQIENGGIGYSTEQNKCGEAWNESLLQDINIYEMDTRGVYSFSMNNSKDILHVQIKGSFENSQLLVKSFRYE